MSGSNLLLDTNIILYFMGGDEILSSILEENQLFISIITEIELLSYHKLSKTEIKKIQEFIGYCKVLGLSEDVKKKAISLRRIHRLKLPDAIILGTALQFEAAFITADKDFSAIDSELVIIYEN